MSKEKTEQNFLQKSKRFFEPYLLEKGVSFRAFLLYSLWGISPIIHIYFIQKIVFLIENFSSELFATTFLYYGLSIALIEFLDYSMKNWGWVENVNAYRKRIDAKYIDEFYTIENTEVEKYGTGKLVSIITRGSDVWSLQLNDFMAEILKIFFALTYAVYMVFQIGFIYGVVFFCIYIFIFVLSAYFNSLSLSIRRERQNEWNEYTKSFVRILMNKIEIMNSGKGNKEIGRMKKHADVLTSINKRMTTSVFFCYRIGESGITWLKAIVIFFVGSGVMKGDFDLSFFVGIFAIFSFLELAIINSTRFFRNFTKEFNTIENMWDFFDTTPQIQGYETGNTFRYKNGSISLQNITYSYDDSKHIFKDFTTEIQGGKITALVGPSGGGKTTLVKLIAGYIRANSGEIEIDNQKLSETSLKSYYSQVGYLTQEPSVFDGSIRENLLYAINPPHSTSPNLGEEKTNLPFNKGEMSEGQRGCDIEKDADFETHLKNIIELAQCQFIYDLPNGLDTEIGERGIKLSGGQKQRLAIAKIFLKNPKIIILDEPTSALDSVSELKITEALNNLFKDRTVLVIAHRLQTVKHADDILVIEHGNIIERGTHSELVKKKGFYKQMLDLQSGF